MAGYHKREIPRGTYGEVSKVTEEYQEMMDAIDQNNPLMVLQEMSDLIGAIEGYVSRYGLTLQDLITMKDATRRAFLDGTREPKKTKKR